MPPDPVVRKLAAILSADAVGYSRLMAQDERLACGLLGQAPVAISYTLRTAPESPIPLGDVLESEAGILS